MAGSELEGVDGARADLFEGATWVLTPVPGTDDTAFATIRNLVTGLGASVVSIPPDRHDSLVAVVSHVPHLTAATMMRLADERSEEHRPLLRLAAGGFRDMTRISAGHPGIWPDICAENRDAIVEELDSLIDALGEVREVVAAGDRERLLSVLERARRARIALPARVSRPEDLVELRVTIPDRQGALAPIFTLATDLDVIVADFEIAHSIEGNEGVLILLVDAELGERFHEGLADAGYRPTLHRHRMSAAREPPTGPTRGRSSPWRARSTPSCGCRARRASPTGPWSVPPWPPGPARCDGVLLADDTEAMIECLTDLGVVIAVGDAGETARVDGRPGALGRLVGDHPRRPAVRHDGALRGPAARLGTQPVLLDGAPPLRARPMGAGFEALRALGARRRRDGGARSPARPHQRAGQGGRRAREVTLRADVSSQFASGLLLSAPARPRGLALHLDGPIVSEPYLDLTVAVMEAFGAVVERPDERTYAVVATGYRRHALPDRAGRVGRVVLLRRRRHRGRPGAGRGAGGRVAPGRRGLRRRARADGRRGRAGRRRRSRSGARARCEA